MGSVFLPGHAAWCTLLLWTSAQIGGFIAYQLRLPRVIGMLCAGLLMRNIPWSAVDAFPPRWGTQMRAAALGTIFLRCGLELDLNVGMLVDACWGVGVLGLGDWVLGIGDCRNGGFGDNSGSCEWGRWSEHDKTRWNVIDPRGKGVRHYERKKPVFRVDFGGSSVAGRVWSIDDGNDAGRR